MQKNYALIRRFGSLWRSENIINRDFYAFLKRQKIEKTVRSTF